MRTQSLPKRKLGGVWEQGFTVPATFDTGLREVMYQNYHYIKQQKLGLGLTGNEASMYTDYKNYAWWLELFSVKSIQKHLYTTVI